MEKTKLIKNSFTSPVIDNPIYRDLSDDVVHEYELHDFIEQGSSGEKDDFVIEKRPIEVDCYHLNKVIKERAKGCDLKSIIARIKQTGDTTLLNQREVIYADGTKQPLNLSDALEEGRRTSEYLDSLSDNEKKEIMSIAKMSDDEFKTYIDGLAKKRGLVKPVEVVQEKEGGAE